MLTFHPVHVSIAVPYMCAAQGPWGRICMPYLGALGPTAELGWQVWLSLYEPITCTLFRPVFHVHCVALLRCHVLVKLTAASLLVYSFRYVSVGVI